MIEDPARCKFVPAALDGVHSAACGAITRADIEVIRKIWEGPRRRDGSFLWYGLPRGADFGGLSRTGGSPPMGQPMGITLDWWRYFLTQNPKWDWTTITPALFEQMWDQSVEEFGAAIGTDNPDLTGFRERGGKLLLWHGWADPVIFPEGTIDYYMRVRERMGAGAAEFVRLFK